MIFEKHGFFNELLLQEFVYEEWRFFLSSVLGENASVLVHSKTRALKNLGEQKQFGVSSVACSGISTSTRF